MQPHVPLDLWHRDYFTLPDNRDPPAPSPQPPPSQTALNSWLIQDKWRWNPITESVLISYPAQADPRPG
ncbi:hypothetical protein E2C01_041858 [Portunus trituberculatus]|uniref:Uncharacterized protein n=1 Tax=Portunus trituberculatus TaxID=210409 RepID=A0A5B7FST7_PORTR|nr:hypothetical protein [Portunus trituberculatus]